MYSRFAGSVESQRFALQLLTSAPIAATSPLSILWTAPTVLLASLMIAWGAESAQFFMAQGIALAILARTRAAAERTSALPRSPQIGYTSLFEINEGFWKAGSFSG